MNSDPTVSCVLLLTANNYHYESLRRQSILDGGWNHVVTLSASDATVGFRVKSDSIICCYIISIKLTRKKNDAAPKEY